MKKLTTLLGQFLDHMEIERNRSQKTVANYRFYLTRFLDWLGDSAPDKITEENAQKYRLWLSRLIDVHGEPLKTNTQNYHLIALRSFLKYLAKQNVKTLAAKKITLMKTPAREVTFLEGSDLNKMLESPLKLKNSKSTLESVVNFRDKAILELLFSTGLRVSELSQLKIKDINLKNEMFTITGNKRKPRIISTSEQARYWLLKYLNKRKDLNPYLFISHDKRTKNTATIKPRSKKGKFEINNQPLTPRSIQRIVQKHARAAGIAKAVTPHTLRHSYATNLIRKGADIGNVQTILGHKNITTTQIYIEITNKKTKKICKKKHGKKRTN